MKRFGLFAVLSVLLFADLVGSPRAAAGSVEGPAGSWVAFENWPYPLGSPYRYYVQGNRMADGSCGWQEDVTLGPGSAVVEGREVGIDTSTCLVLMERGTPPAWAVASAFSRPDGGASFESGGGAATFVPSGSDSAGAALVGVAATTQHSQAAFKSYWEDPIWIDVNSVSDATDWYWNGSCVTSSYGAWEYGWYTPTGWWKVSSNQQNTYNCTETTVSSYAHYANDKFCPGDNNRTHAYYDRNTVHGRYNGSATRSIYTYVSGGCSGFLHSGWLFCIESPIGSGAKCTWS